MTENPSELKFQIKNQILLFFHKNSFFSKLESTLNIQIGPCFLLFNLVWNHRHTEVVE